MNGKPDFLIINRNLGKSSLERFCKLILLQIAVILHFLATPSFSILTISSHTDENSSNVSMLSSMLSTTMNHFIKDPSESSSSEKSPTINLHEIPHLNYSELESNQKFNHSKNTTGPIKICKVKDVEKLNQCLKEVLDEIKPRLGMGIPEIGLPGMDPLLIPILSFEHGGGNIKIAAKFADVEITGLSNFNESDFWVDIDNQTLDFNVTFPNVLLAGSYQLSGNLLFVPVAGDGHFWMNLGAVNSWGSGKLSSPLVRRGVILQEADVDLNIESIKVHLTNLFNGDRLLGPVINNFLNDNSQEIFEELRPQIGAQVGEMLTLIANKALTALPADYFDDIADNETIESTSTTIPIES